MLNPQQATRLQAAASEAVKCEVMTGIPAELMVAQWAIESGWGDHAVGNNCFGIKAYTGAAGRQLLTTTEWFNDAELARFLALGDGRTAESCGVIANGRIKYRVQDWFATFPRLSDCFARRAALFTVGRYAPFALAYKQNHDFVALVNGIGPIYATAPGYAATVLGIAGSSQVKSAIAVAREA